MSHTARAQFQCQTTDIVSPETKSSQSPIPVSHVLSIYDILAVSIEVLKDKKLAQKALQKVESMKQQIEGAVSPGCNLKGAGLGRNTFKKTFDHDNKSYRIDFELSGEVTTG